MSSRLQERFGIDPLSQFVLKLPRLVDQQLAVLGEDDAGPFERPRRRTLEVDPGESETAAVAGTLELRFSQQVVRRAAQMRARAQDCVETAGVRHDVVGRPNDPDAKLLFPALV